MTQVAPLAAFDTTTIQAVYLRIGGNTMLVAQMPGDFWSVSFGGRTFGKVSTFDSAMAVSNQFIKAINAQGGFVTMDQAWAIWQGIPGWTPM